MSETEEELRARLSEKEDRIAELENEVEQYEAERADVARAYAEALAAGDTVFDEDDLVEKFEVAELREKFEATEDATLAEAEPAVQSGGGETDTEEAALSESDRERKAELEEKLSEVSGKDGTLAENARRVHAAELAEITGDDTETIVKEYN